MKILSLIGKILLVLLLISLIRNTLVSEAVIITGSLILLVAGLYVVLKAGSPTQNQPSWQDGTLAIIAGILVIHAIAYHMSPNWWVALVKRDGFVLFQLAIVMGIRMAANSRNFVKIVGKATAILASIAFVICGWYAYADSKTLHRDSSAETIIHDFWWRVLRTPAITEDELKREAEQMIAIAAKESQFNQYEPDGITPLRSRRKGYVCAMQLEEEWLKPWTIALKEEHPKENYDMSALEGCLNMALWVRNHFGTEAWSEDEIVRKKAVRKTIRLVASPDYPTERIATPGRFYINEEGEINVITSRGATIPDGPGVVQHFGNPRWVSFQSRVENEGYFVYVTRYD